MYISLGIEVSLRVTTLKEEESIDEREDEDVTFFSVRDFDSLSSNFSISFLPNSSRGTQTCQADIIIRMLLLNQDKSLRVSGRKTMEQRLLRWSCVSDCDDASESVYVCLVVDSFVS